MGIGIGDVITHISDYNYKIIELNKYLYEMFKDDCHLENGDYFKYVRENIFENTSFVVRHSFWFFSNLRELGIILDNFKNQKDKGNYLLIEGVNIQHVPKCINKIILCDQITLYFIKL